MASLSTLFLINKHEPKFIIILLSALLWLFKFVYELEANLFLSKWYLRTLFKLDRQKLGIGV